MSTKTNTFVFFAKAKGDKKKSTHMFRF